MVKLAIVGATGAVGIEALKLIEKKNIHFDELLLIASEASKGKKVIVKNKEYELQVLNDKSFDDVDYAILFVDAELSNKCVGLGYGSNCIFIDNSSAFRMNPRVPLVIPEVNFDEIKGSRIISNPNCSTILLLMVLYPLHKVNKIKEINVSTYQAASGAGIKAMKELEAQAESFINGTKMNTQVFGRQYLFNAFSHNSALDLLSGFNGEEIKMVNEIHKILDDCTIIINPTCIRIPTLRSHLESVTIKFTNETDVKEIKEILNEALGVIVYDFPEDNKFPEPLLTSEKEEVFVGRIRKSYNEDPRVFQLILSGDQLWKGASLNALQIYDKLINQHPKQ